MGWSFIRQPGNAVGGMVQHSSSHSGFLDHPVAIKQRANPSQIHIERPERTPPQYNAGIGRIVGDGVENLARNLALGIDLLDARVDDLDSRRAIGGGGEHVEDCAMRPGQPVLQDERQFHLDARHDETADRDVAAFREEHVVEKATAIRLGDIRRALHRSRGEADLVALQRASLGNLVAHPFALDGVGVLDGNVGKVERKLPYLGAALLSRVQTGGASRDDGRIEHGLLPRYVRLPRQTYLMSW